MPQIEVFRKHNSFRTILDIINGYRVFLRKYYSPNLYHTVLKIEVIKNKVLSRDNKFKRLIPISYSPFPNGGFTLIELITAIAVLAILASTALAVIDPMEQFKKSADTRRKADLAQMQRALEVYYQDHGRYPAASSIAALPNRMCNDTACTDIVDWGTDWRPYMDVLPIDQKAAHYYAYWTDADWQSYAIYASLDRGGRDKQACTGANNQCTGAALLVGGINACGGICNYGVSSPNIAP